MFVYVITNELTGKAYVGQTRCKSVNARLYSHATRAQRSALTEAIASDGIDNFSVRYVRLPEDADRELLDEIERRLIVHLGTRWPDGYNMQGGGAPREMHPESREKIAASKRGKPRSPEVRQKLRDANTGNPKLTGRKCPEWQKQLLREKFAGKPLSDEQREGLRAAWARKKAAGWTAPPVSQEQRAKISAANKGKLITLEMRARISRTLKGRALSAETRAKMSAARKGKPRPQAFIDKMTGHAVSAETRAKISIKKRERDALRRQAVAV